MVDRLVWVIFVGEGRPRFLGEPKGNLYLWDPSTLLDSEVMNVWDAAVSISVPVISDVSRKLLGLGFWGGEILLLGT
jgi:hypothetical protein